MKSAEVRELSVGEVEKKLRDTRDELLHMHLRKETGQVERPHLIRELRRDIARFETIHREKLRAK